MHMEEYSKNLQVKNNKYDFLVEFFNETKKKNYLELRFGDGALIFH